VPTTQPLSYAASLTATKVAREIGRKYILRDVTVTVGPETKLGVVGPNGVGKSTLLRILAGLVRPDSGSVELSPPVASVGYLAQEPQRRLGETVAAHLGRMTGVAGAEVELQRSAEALGRGETGAADAYAGALERWERLGAADFEMRVESVLGELGLADLVLHQQTSTLSGGQAARVALATILLSRFDLTLLDEPTNDLDFDGLSILERFVNNRGGGVVVVSHDRAFLDRTITSVLEIDEYDRTARLYRGGWAAYLEERKVARRHAEEAYAEYESARSGLLDRAARERQWATTGIRREKSRARDNDKVQRSFRVNRTEQLASRARRTERAINRLETVDKPWEGWTLHFTIGQAPRAGAVVARLDGAVVEKGSFRLGPLSLEIGWGERVALVGPNGAGKTTLLDALFGRVPLAAGTRWIGPGVIAGELGQSRGALSGRGNLLDSFMARTGLEPSAARSLLAKFGLGAAHVVRRAESMSPGERTRAELAAFQARGVNLLVLDEPTNHLDLPAVEQLEQALDGYRGTLLLVSHDRALLEAVEITRTVDLTPRPAGDEQVFGGVG
jgi:ATPase subunit of ABC transporter with duplicated ATPase domains